MTNVTAESEGWHLSRFLKNSYNDSNKNVHQERGICMEQRTEGKKRINISTIALIIGGIFVVLAGGMFATSTWKAMSSLGKVITASALAGIFFGASLFTERRMHIGKTSMTCYVLGCAFLFFTMVTAGYFQMLGPVFGRGGQGWWCVFIMGGMVMSAVMAWGRKRFGSRIYGLLWQAVTLVWVFFLAVYVAAEMAERFFEWQDPCFAVDVFGVVSVAATAALGGYFAWKKNSPVAAVVFHGMTAILVHDLILFMPFEEETQFFMVSVVMAALLWLMIRKYSETVFGTAGKSIYGILLLPDAMMLAFFGLIEQGGILTQLENLAVVVLVGIVLSAWGKEYRFIKMLMPAVLWYGVVPAASAIHCGITGACGLDQDILLWVTFVYVSGYGLWNMVKKDGCEIVILAMGVIMFLYAGVDGLENWETAWMAFLGCYACYFTWQQKDYVALPILICLVVDGLMENRLADALVLECICLAQFFLAHKRGNRKMVKICGGLMIAIALYVMRDFWTYLAWWVYLLAAGIGLIVFAAFREKRD